MWLLLLSLIFPTYGAECRHSSKRLSCVHYVGNYDGDTITFTIPRIYPLFGEKVRVRVSGVDAPEMTSTKACERDLAKKAKRMVRDMMRQAQRIDLVKPKRDKFFRILADVQADGVSVGETLLAKGLAISYHGEAKPKYDWCKNLQQYTIATNAETENLGLPYDPYQGAWSFSGDLEPSVHAHNVKIYMNGSEARTRMEKLITEGYICEKRYGPMVLCRKLLDQVVIPERVQAKMREKVGAMNVQFESYEGGGSLVTDGEGYKEWNVPSEVNINGEQYDSYVFSKSSSGLVKVLIGYDDKQKDHHTFVAKRDALKYHVSVVVENKWEWDEYTAFAVFRSEATE